jgi:hypothetical protein
MKVRSIRQKLEQIPGALWDFPSPESPSGDEKGVIGTTLWSPDEARRGENVDDLLDSDGSDDYGEEDGEALYPVFEWGAHSDDAIRRLGNAADEAIRQSARSESGSDALGHYLSFHFRGMQWGATVKLSGIAWLATQYFQSLPTDDRTKAKLAFHAILQHELFHFAVDVAITQAELSQRRPWLKPALAARKERGVAYSCREEMLANVWMLTAFRTALPGFRIAGKQAALRSFVQMQPPGYRDALTFPAKRWREELHELIFEFAENAGCERDNPLLWGWGYDWPCHFPVWPFIDWRNCAIHLVDDSARFGVPPGWLVFLSSLTAIEESAKFRKQLAALSRREQEGWERTKWRAQENLSAAGLDFKQWPKGGKDVWSIRIDHRFRAHLHRDRDAGRWVALEIGSHKAMGHG